jgi:hypothetical protein
MNGESPAAAKFPPQPTAAGKLAHPVETISLILFILI